MRNAVIIARWINGHRQTVVKFATLLLIVSVSATRARAADDKSLSRKEIEGYWLGTLKLSSMELRLGFQIKKKDNGSLVATGDSLDQGLKDLPVESVLFSDGVLTLKMPAMRAVYIGKLQANGNTIEGELDQGKKMSLVLKRQEKRPAVSRSQRPEKSSDYHEEDVTFASSAKGVTLAGTFTKPKGKGPFAAAILISGSGPQDRDETVAGHKPFFVLADHLTRQGIAVLRFDDRGFAKSTGNYQTATTNDFADDAAGAVEYLKARNDVEKIGLIGHSEGGIVAGMVTANRSDVAFVVLLASPGVPGDALMLTQGKAMMKESGSTDKVMIQRQLIQQKLFALVKETADEAKLLAAVAEMSKDLSETENAAIRSQMSLLTSRWFKCFVSLDPRPIFSRVRCPVLALNGQKDLQVLAKENLAEIEKAVRAGGNSDVLVKEMRGLNHLFQPCTCGLPSEYAKIKEKFSAAALETIASWIANRTGSDRKSSMLLEFPRNPGDANSFCIP